MKLYDIYHISEDGRRNRLVQVATEEQFEEFKKNGRTHAKFYMIKYGDDYSSNLKDYDFCVFVYDAKIVYRLYEMRTFTNSQNQEEDFWVEIKAYTTEKAANKRIKDIANNIFGKDKEIDIEKYKRFYKTYKVKPSYQTYEEANKIK